MITTKNNNGIQIRRKIKAIYYGFLNFFRHYARYVRNVNADYYLSQENFLPILIANYHVIEKCLAMPNFELGHAKERVSVVCGDLVKYRELGFDQNNVQYISALQAVDEYRRVHEDAGFDLGKELNTSIGMALDGTCFPQYNQPTVSVDAFFAKQDGFAGFAKSRHSCRTFSEETIPLDVIRECVDIARTTPTACNRQPNKTYVVNNKNLLLQIVNMQGGGRGFSEEADKILVITSNVSVFGYEEIEEAFKSGGMYVMNLLYALHDKHIGACPLEWNERKHEDNKLRKLLNIPDNEEIIMLIAIGYPPQDFKYVTSVRNNIEDSLVLIE